MTSTTGGHIKLEHQGKVCHFLIHFLRSSIDRVLNVPGCVLERDIVKLEYKPTPMAFGRSSLFLLGVAIVLWSFRPTLAQSHPPPNITHAPGHCLWYKQCGPGENGGKYNCFYNGPPLNVTEGSAFQKSLLATCPQYANGPVCCDQNQLDTLTNQIGIPRQLLSRCPACLRNFIDHFCATTCDPDSAMYTDGTVVWDNDLGKFQVTTATVYLTDNYGQEVFNSCRNVQNPSDNAAKVVDLMCGGAIPCSRDAWFKYLGIGNPYVPFPMTYKFGNKAPNGMVPRNTSFYPCNYHDGDDYSLQCSCTDCGTKDLCPPPPSPLKNTFPLKEITIIVASVCGVLVLLLFTAALIFGIVQLARSSNKGYAVIGSTSSRSGYGAIEDDDSESPTTSVGSINDADLDLNTQGDGDDVCCCVAYSKGGAYFERWIKRVFYKWGKFSSRFWYIVIVGVLLVVAALSCGMIFFQLVTDPVHLWSSPSSRARQEKNYFDANFSPFYRTEMIIVKAINQTKEAYFVEHPALGTGAITWAFGPALQFDVMNETFFLQDYLTNMKVAYKFDNGTEGNITLEDICFQPLYPDNKYCTIMSVMNYFQNDYSLLSQKNPFTSNYDYPYHVYYCARDPTSPQDPNIAVLDPQSDPLPCLGQFGGPIDPNLIFGGFSKDPATGLDNYQNATTLIITFTVNNHLNESDNRMAEAWEKAYLDHLKNFQGEYINITFLSERSTVDELSRESSADELTVLISYLFMFAYITLFLGHIRSVATLLIDMKFTVGFIGVLLVLLAVLSAIGLLSYIGIAASLIILEVVPFLVLAVGVDNLFIIVHSYERQTKKFANIYGDLSKVPVNELVGRALGEVAPSLLLTSLSETAAFLLGGISTMPAVRSFSFYAGTAVFFNFILQITIFVAVVSLDAHRQLANRFDILICLKLKGKFNPKAGVDILHFVMKWFAKFLLYPIVRPFVLLFFGITTTLSLLSLFRLNIGLDQTLAFPKDSYLISYFNDMTQYLHAGSPVYFVIKEGVDYSQMNEQNKICSQAGCLKDSLGTQVNTYSKAENLTHIAEPAMLWVDTYFQWISPASNCCGIIRANNTSCRPPGKGECDVCLKNYTKNYRPYPEDFKKFLKPFLKANPDTDCAAAGHAAFGGGVKLYTNQTSVKTSYVMTYHTVLKTSEEYIDAIRWARRLSDNLTTTLNITVFPYSVFYVFYEQYLTTIHDMALNLGVSISAVFLVTFLMMGLNLWAALIIMISVTMIIVHMLGCMAVAGISANAISLVNLVMTVGISVEFCSHIVRWFCSCPLPTRYLRAQSALANMGASVFSGITVTKFLGVFVLLFAKSQLFEIYYFRMYMFMLLWGALVGLVFLPVLLSYIGPSYCPVRNIPSPYDQKYMPVQHTEQTTSTTPNIPNRESPHNSTGTSKDGGPHIPPPYSNQYPTLPNLDDYEVGGNEHQRQGVQYVSTNRPSETTQLINQ